MKDEISEYYSRARARIKALEAEIKTERANLSRWIGDDEMTCLIEVTIDALESDLERARQID